MKQLFFMFSFLIVASFSANAQKSCAGAATSCAKTSKACCASKASASVDANVSNSLVAADAAIAASNGAVTKRTCEISGTTAYYEKSVCSKSGKVSWDEVYFDNTSNSFTRVASASMEKDADGTVTKSCAGAEKGKACCKGKAASSCSKKEGAK